MSSQQDYYYFEPEKFLAPPMEAFLRRMFGARWGLILVSAPLTIDLDVILRFLANFSIQQVYYSEFSASQGEFDSLQGENRTLKTLEEVVNEAQDALPKEQPVEWHEPERPRINRNSDIIFISEIGPSLMPLVVENSMTGQLVVAGIRHEGSFPALKHLIELHGSTHLTAASLMGIIGLNLVNRICRHCKTLVEYDIKTEDILFISGHERTLRSHRGIGCEKCEGSGSCGKILIHEGFELTENLRSSLMKNVPLRNIRMQAKKEGMATLLDAAWSLVEAGETTLDEVVRIADVTDPGGHGFV